MNRRRIVQHTGIAAIGAAVIPSGGCRTPQITDSPGQVIGQPGAEEFGNEVLADGGNAFDAIAAAALVGAVTQPHQTGIGGYCMYGTFAVDGGKRIVCMDANSTAPAAMTRDIFKPGADVKVRASPSMTSGSRSVTACRASIRTPPTRMRPAPANVRCTTWRR
jgi:gamma-glutamyltranspeptidase/glutathione hydrolase